MAGHPHNKPSHLCVAEETAVQVQVEQTKQDVHSYLSPPHHRRISIYGALPRHPLGNATLFLNRQGHRELTFSGGQQHTRTCARAHLPAHKDNTHITSSVSVCLSITEADMCEAVCWSKNKATLLISTCAPPPLSFLRHWLKWNCSIKVFDWTGKASSRPAATGTAQRWSVQCQSLVFFLI